MLLRPMYLESRETVCISNFVLNPWGLYDSLQINATHKMKNLTFSFDIGYASIGWSVLEYSNFAQPNITGTGVVLFESDSCLASKRREYRRMRRTIRSRRKRIDRIGTILQTHGIITAEERRLPGHPAPFFLASRALQGKIKLNGIEIWQVLRWYAHNRGYDGNTQWSKDGDNAEDTQRVEAAKAAMRNCGTTTMAETLVSILKLNTNKTHADFDINSPKYKNLNMAFPRHVVVNEVAKLLKDCSDLDRSVCSLILSPVQQQLSNLQKCGIKLPKRYIGSILFGQLLPRFDNRIIARCPITWANTYREALNQGETEAKSKKLADKYAKVPNADCEEFYAYRFARILANIRVNDTPLSAEIRQKLFADCKIKGKFTKNEFSKAVEVLTDNQPNNIVNYFHLVPDADKALILCPQNDSQRAKGRAPYARPVLRKVLEEVLNGEDPTKAALSPLHPNGETKTKDGILFCLSDPESEVCKMQSSRTIEQQTNNHLVRHRMLIFDRLLSDMIEHYADGDASCVTHCCIEVNRELKEYSGLTAKEIEKKLNEKLSQFKEAKKYLEKNAPQLKLTGGLIRKCRIALDMNWTCPYTEMKYSALDLPKMDKEHIIPFASRNSNAMASLVLTYPEVNAMKGKRCAMEFIKEFQGQPVANKSNLSITTLSRYIKFVEKLDVKKGSPDDKKRKIQRKKLLLLEKTPNQNATEQLGFTDGQLTQSSHLMKLGAQIAKKKLHKAKVISIPGQVTAEVRKAWKLMGTLTQSCPDILNENNEVREKSEIRNITHLHHALDACTLALILHYIPQGDNGRIWQIIAQRHISTTDVANIKSLPSLSALKVTEDKRIFISELPSTVKEALSLALNEKRVVKHVPADMGGAKLKLQYKGIIMQDGKPLMQNGRVVLNEKNKKGQYVKLLPSKIIGLKSAKMKAIKAALMVDSNYGIALDPKPSIIRHVGVYKQLKKIRQANAGNSIRILKVGECIRIDKHKDDKRNTVWRITSIKDNETGLALDLQKPESAISANLTNQANWLNVKLDTLLKCDIHILKNSYIGRS